MCDRVGHIRNDALTCFVSFITSRLHCEDHVRAGITIRHWKDVESINDLLVRAQPFQAGADQFTHRCSVDRAIAFGQAAARVRINCR